VDRKVLIYVLFDVFGDIVQYGMCGWVDRACQSSSVLSSSPVQSLTTCVCMGMQNKTHMNMGSHDECRWVRGEGDGKGEGEGEGEGEDEG
jgi:hypothetical protein